MRSLSSSAGISATMNLISISSGMEIPGHFQLHHTDTERRRKAVGWEWGTYCRARIASGCAGIYNPGYLLAIRLADGRSTDEGTSDCAVVLRCKLTNDRAGGSAAGRRKPALHHGVLLQGAVGASAGVSEPVSQEPLPATEKGSGERAHAGGEN